MIPDRRDADTALLASTGRHSEAAALARPARAPADPLQQLMGCPFPVWENQDESRLTDSRCVIFSGPDRCKGNATHWAWIGCTIGEHLDKSSVCGSHAAMMGKDTTAYHCRRCWDAVGTISKARVIKVEEIDDDDDQDIRGWPSALR